MIQDEIDALGTTRSENGGGGDRHSGVLTTLLNEMDGVEDLVGVTIVAATNRPEDIVGSDPNQNYSVLIVLFRTQP